jgi:CO/xanthine dehydrogenase FAD-binding subunit
VGPTPVRAHSAERALQRASGDADAIREAIREAAQLAVADLSPAGDLHASEETRLALAQVYLRRALELAVSRARNER